MRKLIALFLIISTGFWAVQNQAQVIVGRRFGKKPPVSGACNTVVNGFTCSQSITIDHTKVPNTDQTDFPVLVNDTNIKLATIANGGVVTSASGFDIVFTSDSGCTTMLKFDRAAWTASTGANQFWVKIATLSHTVDTVIYRCYGKSSIVTDQQDAVNVWTNNYKGVFHHEDNAANTTVVDASGNGNLTSDSSVNTNARSTTGQFTLGLNYNGDSAPSDSMDETGNGPNLANVLTYSGWVNERTQSIRCTIASNQLVVDESHGSWTYINTDGKVHYVLMGVVDYTINIAVSNATWTYVAVTSSGNGGTATAYVGASGGSLSSASTAIGTQAGTPNKFLVGGRYNGFGVTDRCGGVIDEVHFTSVARSSDWINVEFNNQNPSGAFETVGNPQ